MGIIAEYNPFHNGHQYHIETAKSKCGADCVVAIMSGSFTQRGQLAVGSKWERARWAVENGIDLVIELPTIYATSNAGAFAKGGVSILEAMGIDYIAFGAESGEEALMGQVEFLKAHNEEIQSLIKEYAKEGCSYPKAREKALSQLGYDIDENSLDNPNDILAIEYLMNMSKCQPVIIERKGTGYNNKTVEGLPSATAIRHMASEGQNFSPYVPKSVENIRTFNEGKMWEMVQFKAISMTPSQIDKINSADEGLGNLLKQKNRYANSYEEMINLLKSKRYTHTRISRFLCQLVIGITKEDASKDAIYVRVLGFNEKGSGLLKELKKKNDCLPIITNVNKVNEFEENVSNSLNIDIKANDLYNLANGLNMYSNSDYVKMPVIIQK